MSFWRDFWYGPTPATPAVVSPFTPQDSLQQITVAQLWPEHATVKTINRDTALRIPAVKRAHDIACGVLARLPWAQYDGATRLAVQPEWLVNTRTGVPPRALRWGVYSDLFMTGWAVIGFELGADGQPIDALHIPQGFWTINQQTGAVDVDARIKPRYQQRVVPIDLGYGSSGMLTDGLDTLRDARAIEAAYRDRIENPIAQTVLSIAADRWDGWTAAERAQFRKAWIEGRSGAGGATALKPDWVTAEFSGQLPSDLFESGRNANRLDIANHAGVPAGLLEGSKQGGGTDIKYSGVENGATRNELWDFGLAKYADAVDARLSLDDVCVDGQSIRVEAAAYLSTPNPTTPLTSED